MYTSVLFDLDGTLTDSGLGITKGVQYALRKYNIIVNDISSLRKFVGPPLTDAFTEYYHFDNEQANAALMYYREYYSEIGIFENALYFGVDVLLHKLQNAGIDLYIATSKPTVYAKKVCDYFNISQYFIDIQGSDLNVNLSNKSAIIKVLLAKYKLDKNYTVMVGDREHDVTGAKNNNINCIGVGYGYGSEEELINCKAFKYVKSINDLSKVLLGKDA